MSRLRAQSLLLLLALLAGCSRSHYRVRADVDAYSILEEKAACTSWAPAHDFTIDPHPASRYFDPTPIDDPLLPIPAPQLYAYDLPPLRSSDTSRFNPSTPVPEVVPDPYFESAVTTLDQRLPPVRLPAPFPAGWDRADLITSVSHEAAYFEVIDQELLDSSDSELDEGEDEAIQTVAAIPDSAWEDLPQSCRLRMYEFERLQEEYRRTYGSEVDPADLDSAPRLTLEDIVDLALINSREYQLRKEVLYRVALNLSLQRFAYDLKFSAGGNRTSPNYAHSRTAGVTVNTLGIPTTLQSDQVLRTGGDLLARFANDVVLTFNGPQGFAADVGSSLFFDLSQSIFQRDIRFEALTQSERDVVYAARDFARFRKQLFTDLATSYYNLIRNYRQVEIDSQNYFDLVRLFNQTEAEYRAEQVPRFQVDQVEEQVLTGRRMLIGTCNALEQALDNLKISVGLPTETLTNLDLRELEQLTLRDELAVNSELIRREQDRLEAERSERLPSPVILLTTAIELSDRILQVFEIQERLGETAPEKGELVRTRALIRVEELRENGNELRRELEKEQRSESPQLSRIVVTKLNLADALLDMMLGQRRLSRLFGVPSEQLEDFRLEADRLEAQTDSLRDIYENLLAESRLLELPNLDGQVTDILRRIEEVIQRLDLLAGRPRVPPQPEVALQQHLQVVDDLLEFSRQVREGVGSGLVPVRIPLDDAMMTALVSRYDLMNERGGLADDWRRIKLSGDELRSVLNLNANHTLRTRTDFDRPFDFTFDDSLSQLRVTFDAPLNRRAQRNDFRTALIDYNVGLRRLMQLEDNIKLAVRNDLRNLELDQQQYTIDVASAALNSKRVVSTALQFRLGIGTVRATDILEAQNNFAQSLSDVARGHIDYIVDRMRLFFDLELMVLDENGFWPELYDEQLQPEPYYQLHPEAMPAYGELPRLHYSAQVRRMQQIPPGTSAVHGEPRPVGEEVRSEE